MKMLMAALAASLLGSTALAQGAAGSAQMGSGATFSVSAGWTQHGSGSLVEVDPLEPDTRLVIVDVAGASDARAAVAAAWRAYRGKETHALRLLTPLPARDGWDERAAVQYETSPTEALTVQATALRKGAVWTVAILDGARSTVEKRNGPLGVMLGSLRPAGYVRETFGGRTAHRLDAGRVQALLEFVSEAANELNVPGVGIALIDHGQIVYEGGVGVREAGSPAAVDAHTRFMVASNTKGMSTLLLARLVDQGKLRWDEPVTQAYPAFRLGSEETTRQVLVRHLVCACTGVPRKDLETVFMGTAKTPPSSTFTLLAATEPTSRFGEVFQYNNLMASAAGYVGGHVVYPQMEVGAAYDRAMAELIFQPLAMRDTTFSFREALAADHASPHGEDADGTLHVIGFEVSGAFTPFRPAGGAWSSPHDMILYVQNELSEGVLPGGKRLVSAENLLARRARGVPTGENQWYGMGLQEDATWGVTVIHHGGDLPGFHSDIIAIPSAGVGAVILTNADNGASMRRPFMRRLLELLYDGRPEAVEDVASITKRIEAQRLVERPHLLIPPPAVDLNGLATSYVNPDLGRLTIERSTSGARLHAAAWTSDLASRHNDDGTTSLITLDPQMLGRSFVVGGSAGKRTLTTRDGQHVYVFTEGS